MIKPSIKSIILLALMLLSAALGATLRPRISLADERAPIDLATMVPKAFGDWREEVNLIKQVVNPQQKSLIDSIYSQTLSRNYVNKQGYRVMLSIAYGKNQSDALQLHKPEICYPAQGFQLFEKHADVLKLGERVIPTTRLMTKLNQRQEPITYWTVVGEHVTVSSIDKKLTELRYALENRIPDGMLIRVSSTDGDVDNAYQNQDRFARAMVTAIATAQRQRFSGNHNARIAPSNFP